MARINVSAVIRKLIDGLGLSAAFEKVPVEVAEKVLPVFNVNPDYELLNQHAESTDSANHTVLTAHLKKKTFVTSISISYAKSALSTSIKTYINMTPKGKAITKTLNLRYEPLTAGQGFGVLYFNPPLELEKGSIIDIVNSTAIASIDVGANATYYEVDEV